MISIITSISKIFNSPLRSISLNLNKQNEFDGLRISLIIKIISKIFISSSELVSPIFVLEQIENSVTTAL